MMNFYYLNLKLDLSKIIPPWWSFACFVLFCLFFNYLWLMGVINDIWIGLEDCTLLLTVAVIVNGGDL